VGSLELQRGARVKLAPSEALKREFSVSGYRGVDSTPDEPIADAHQTPPSILVAHLPRQAREQKVMFLKGVLEQVVSVLESLK
jgi:hypothetical protein